MNFNLYIIIIDVSQTYLNRFVFLRCRRRKRIIIIIEL